MTTTKVKKQDQENKGNKSKSSNKETSSKHPQYFQAKVNCACGFSTTLGSTISKIDTEICAACHPFFTGKQKLVDSAGRVEKFKKRQAATDKK